MSQEIRFHPHHITLKQFVDFHAAKSDIQRACIATGKPEKQIKAMTVEAVDTINIAFANVAVLGGDLVPTVWVGFRKLGFIPDLKAITIAEYIDLDDLKTTIWPKSGKVFYKHLPMLMATLYRPVKMSWPFGKYYRINRYDADEIRYYMGAVEKLPMSVVNGALLFFSTLQNRLRASFPDYSATQVRKVVENLQAL